GIFKTRDAPITRWQPRQARATTTRLAWICLAAGLTLLLLMQVWAGLSLRGLYADGSYYAARLWLTQSFVVVEPARRTSQMLMQLPVVAAMTLGSPSPLTVARLFSLSTNIMPLCCTLLGFALLPRAMRAYALIPLTVYLCAGMAAAIASVADAPFAAAYHWLLMLLIAVAPLTAGRLAAMLLLGLGALHLHEATGLLGPILILACIMRTREAKLPWQRTGLALTAVLVGIGTSHAVMDMLHPRLVAHRDSFLHDLTSLRWLWSVGGGLNLPAADGVLGLLAFAVLAGAGHAAARNDCAHGRARHEPDRDGRGRQPRMARLCQRVTGGAGEPPRRDPLERRHGRDTGA
ncbi:MAG TPA: hypothetical protein VHX12_08690, partial [Acidisoma sp.]|nr:hypothetical protein [Acidisoma sp.]